MLWRHIYILYILTHTHSHGFTRTHADSQGLTRTHADSNGQPANLLSIRRIQYRIRYLTIEFTIKRVKRKDFLHNLSRPHSLSIARSAIYFFHLMRGTTAGRRRTQRDNRGPAADAAGQTRDSLGPAQDNRWTTAGQRRRRTRRDNCGTTLSQRRTAAGQLRDNRGPAAITKTKKRKKKENNTCSTLPMLVPDLALLRLARSPARLACPPDQQVFMIHIQASCIYISI